MDTRNSFSEVNAAAYVHLVKRMRINGASPPLFTLLHEVVIRQRDDFALLTSLLLSLEASIPK
jgi:hypothetical protein